MIATVATFKETFTAEDSTPPTMDFQDCMDDIGQELGSVERAVAAYDDDVHLPARQLLSLIGLDAKNILLGPTAAMVQLQ